jgi:two-component system, cell cycle sensor histidine kinase and response regulator CckA
VLLLTLDFHELPQRGAQPVILVAEDEVLVRNFLCLLLQREGYQVLAAGDGVEALEVARAHNGTIHMLLTDMVMPGMDGMALAERILRERPGIRVLLVSGTLSSDGQEQNLQLPFLKKPFIAQDLRDKIIEVLKSPPPGAQRS